ncbi:MAG: hypothetical protein CMF52_06775 [Legionellales bacterium]|nr:hypothetical protein [Legionellales bacterium]|tara:strand:- start:7647 stop:7859 length:213 start_codon:yes stop_codon:yes gene_type:complete
MKFEVGSIVGVKSAKELKPIKAVYLGSLDPDDLIFDDGHGIPEYTSCLVKIFLLGNDSVTYTLKDRIVEL